MLKRLSLKLFAIVAFIISTWFASPAAFAQQIISNGQVQIVGNGNTANVTAGNALQTDIHSVGGTTVSLVSGGLPVYIEGSAVASGGTSLADEGAFTLGTTSFTPIGCYFQTTVTTGPLSTGQAGVAQCDANRRQIFVGAGAAGTASGGVVSIQGVASMTPIEISPTTSANLVTNPFFTQISNGTNNATFNSANYTSHYGLDSNILGLDGAVFSATNALFGQLTDGTNAMGAMANYGTAPGAVKALNVNAAITNSPVFGAGTAVIGKTAPVTACGATNYTAAWQALTTSPVAITTTTTCVQAISACNTSASTAYTFTVTDNSGTPVNVIDAVSIPPASCYTWPFYGEEFTSGIKWTASNILVTGAIQGIQ